MGLAKLPQTLKDQPESRIGRLRVPQSPSAGSALIVRNVERVPALPNDLGLSVLLTSLGLEVSRR